MDEEILESLSDLGLSNRESICYTALLELGSSSVGNICKQTKIPSSKIYEILDSLISKGLATYVIIGKIKHYQATNPKIFINLIDERRKDFEKILPQLLLKQKFSSKQNVEMFTGQKALFSLFTELISDAKFKEEYLIFSIDEENKSDQITLFFRNLTIRRSEKKLDVKILKNIKYYKKEKHTKLKLKYTKFNLPQGITIFRDVVVLVTFDNSNCPLAIKITSDTFSSQLRVFFNELWSEAKI
ncbi:MAG: TrmB family transcriptional regulator [Candidatus Woesearchaeota archaeon]